MQDPKDANWYCELGAVDKLRHPDWGQGGVSQKMTQDDKGGGLGKDDG